MRTLAVLPVKSFGRAKQRLGEAVGAEQRRALAQAMAADVLEALGRVDGLDGVIVVSAEALGDDVETARPRERRFAAAGRRVELVHDPEEAGQSAAARRGVRAALERGAERVLLVPGDCPALDPDEVTELLAELRAGVVIVPDRHGAGTNALLIAPPAALAAGLRAGLVRPPRGARPRRRRARADRRACPRSSSTSTPRATSPPCAPRWPRAPAARRAPARCSTGSPPRTRPRPWRLALDPLPGLPEVRPGDDLAALLAGARLEPPLGAGDVLAVAHKVVSKAEGRVRALADVEPGERARALAAEHGKDARHVQAVLDETTELLRADHGRLICRTRHGFVCANAGVDQSNAGAPDTRDPAARGPRRLRPRPARAARRRRRRDHRLVGPPLAPGPDRGRDRLRRPRARWPTGAAPATATAARSPPP